MSEIELLMVKLTYLSLYLINRVRLRRLVIGKSSRILSEGINHSSAYVGMAESAASKSQYPPHEWSSLANELDCEIHDLLPENQTTSTGELVDKIILSFHNEKDVREVILALIKNGFFNTSKTITDTSKHLFIDEHNQIAILSTVMNQMQEERVLKQHPEGFTKGNY